MPRILAGLLLSLGSGALLVWTADLDGTWQAMAKANPWFVGAAVASLTGSLAAKTMRWRNLLPQDPPAHAGRLYRILHVSYLLNNLLPVRLGDVARVAVTAREPGMRVGAVLSSLVTERVADGLTLLSAFVLVSLLLPLPGAFQPWLIGGWAVLVGAAALALIAVAARRGARTGKRGVADTVPGQPSMGRLRMEINGFLQGFQRLATRASLRGVWGWSALAWGGAFAINYFLMRALSIDAPWSVAVVLTCATNLAMLIPSSPGYVGVFHAAAVLSLVPFGVSTEAALGLAVLAHLVNVVPVSLLGLTFLALDRPALRLSRRPARGDAAATDRAA